MPRLVADRLRVVEESNELGSDDLHLVTFVGRKPSSLSSIHINGEVTAWENMSTVGVTDG